MRTLALAIVCFAASPVSAQEAIYEIKNLDFNTKHSDFGASFYENNTLVFAQSKKSSIIKGIPFFNLYQVSEKQQTPPKKEDIVKLSQHENPLLRDTKKVFHETNAVFTKDYKTVYFTRTSYTRKRRVRRDAEGYVTLKLYKATNVNGTWKNVKELPFSSNQYSVAHPTLSNDEKKLYFSSNMPGTHGDSDIFVVDILADNTYSKPKNLGPTINTKGKEMFPFVDENNNLYFSSTSHKNNQGGLDIYCAKFENNTYKTPKNLGFPLNSNADDFSFIKKRGENTGYFSSNRPGGKGKDDIYSFIKTSPILDVENDKK